ncbi:NAD(P)-dependent oxidoreductase [Luteolibacter pohnpeiensis]|uniref:NAD(P)-dependent oxidoreductase n=1 Tax=Luteolibacter pohnpeiensis TaxID=454153 RepID=A0A934S475_9BACT|nr:NAD(P)-dependent oxidoreductase [Luteolibacter pohnpeiensis]MBK1882850.1 NAD(P)-dependent oxidoreductase [Luteolibacter pohnpeiensis]
MKILVTGGSGFIGSNLVGELKKAGHEILSLDPFDPRNPAHQDVTQKIDPLDRSGILAAFKNFDPDYVYHLGARTDLLGGTIGDYSSNTEGVRIVIDALKGCTKVKGVFFASSRLVCEIGYMPKGEEDYCPSTPYGESKVEGEQIVRNAGITVPWCLFRPTSIWGPWFEIPYKTFFMMVSKGRYIHPKGQKIRKSFGYVGNSVHYLMKLMDLHPEVYSGKTFYLCDEPPLEVSAWANQIADAMKVSRPKQVPYFILKSIALGGDLLKLIGMKNPPLTSFRLSNLTCEMLHDGAFLRDNIGAPPYSLEEGVSQTVEWLKSSGSI